MNPELRRTVEVMLTKKLFGATGSAPQLSLSAEGAYLDDYDRGAPGREAYRYGEGALLAIEALGLLPASEAAQWKQRFELARGGWSTGPSSGAEEKEHAEEHLERLARSLAAATDTERRSELLGRFNASFALYLQTGLERREDASRWGARIEEALGRTVEELYEPGSAEPTPMGGVLRVVPTEPARHDGLCVTAVALHEHGFELHWHELREGHFDPDDSFETRGFVAADDVGTEYASFDMGGASWSERAGVFAVTGHSGCRTPVPDGASELRISRGTGQWLVSLG